MTPATSINDREKRERRRIAALQAFKILDTPPEDAFDELTRLAASIAGTPIALISLVDSSRQWFKSKVGLAVSETPRDVAFCAHAIEEPTLFVIPDASKDGRFAKNPLVTGDPNIRFYAGAPLITTEGHALGTICVIDYIPREFTPEQQEALQELGSLAMAHIELRQRTAVFARDNYARNQVLKDIKAALDRGEFLLYYQPVMDVAKGNIQGLEALIRWDCPERGLMSPEKFLPTLDDTNLVVDIGNWVMRRAAADYRDWLSRGLVAPRIVVNVSPRHLQHPNFLSELEIALDPDGVSPAPLNIEINESVVLDNSHAVIDALRGAQRLGVEVTIDDFGTGYSMLRHLPRLPIDMLKIDRGFIANMTEDADDMELVSSIISLGHSLDLSVAAKGVETEEQRRLLKLLRCDHMQGFLFSKPLPRERIEHVLRRDQANAAAAWERLLNANSRPARYGAP